MSKDLLKEAIADAKAVRETAIANAKIALEEAFTPKLQSMLSAKLQEDDMEEDDLGLEEPAGDEVDVADAETEVDATEVPVEEPAMEEEEEEEMTEQDDPNGLEDEDLGADENTANGETTEDPGDEGEIADLELESIIKELESDEDLGADEQAGNGETTEDPAGTGAEVEEVSDEIEEGTATGLDTKEDPSEDIDLDEVIKSLSEEDHEEMEEGEDELEEAYKTIRSLKSTLQEVNLLNAKLLFSNKLFKGNTLSESQKMKVIETFDRASNLREVKLVYTTLAESFTGRSTKTRVAEGLASKKSKSTAPKGRIVESNDMAGRMKKLAGLL